MDKEALRALGARSAMFICCFCYSTLTPWIPSHLISKHNGWIQVTDMKLDGVVTGNLTTSIIGLGRSINNFTFSIPANNGPSLILIDNVFDISSHIADFSGMCKEHCIAGCHGHGMNEHHLGSPPRLEVGNRILIFVPIAVDGGLECNHHVQHNRAHTVIIQAATATCVHDEVLTVTQGTIVARTCLVGDCLNLAQFH